MDYIKQLNDFRQLLHKDIIITAIKDTRECSLPQLEFKTQLEFTLVYYRPGNGPGMEKVKVTGLDVSSGELLATNLDNEVRTVHYQDLTLENLAVLHSWIIAKNYYVNELVW